jgi:hypothetical protein
VRLVDVRTPTLIIKTNSNILIGILYQ